MEVGSCACTFRSVDENSKIGAVGVGFHEVWLALKGMCWERHARV